MTLDQLKSEFFHWRTNKVSGADQIPQHLWDKVFLLETYGHSISSLCRELSISGKQVSVQRMKQKCHTSTEFIEINTDVINKTPKLTDNRCDINLNFKDNTTNINISINELEHFLPKIKDLFQ